MPDCLQPSDEIQLPARIGLVADTHRRSGSALGLPPALLQGLDGCDVILHAGDFNSWAVHETLAAVAPVYGVYGNNDEPDVIARLPAMRYFTAGDLTLGLIHGHQAGRNARDATVAAMAGRVDCAIYGHSHLPDWSHEGSLTLVNPGSPTQRRRAQHRCFAIMSLDEQARMDIDFVELS